MVEFLKSKMRSTIGIAFALLVISPAIVAQTNYGAVRGEVKDTQGALVRSASVTLTNQATKVIRIAVTNDAGIYQFGAVDPGTYSVTITLSGFKTFQAADTTVALGATVTVDAALEIGATGETVEVTAAAAPILDTASASGGQLFSEQQLTQLPSNGRNPFLFERMDSNVVIMGNPLSVRAEDQTGSSQVSLSGAPSGFNNYVVDGIPISTSQGSVTFIPSLEAVSDAKVQANTYDAEVGRAGGGTFNTSLKSGTAQYHGVLYGETRQTNWAANNWFNVTNSPTPDDTTYLYAGAFGGPIPFTNKVKFLDKTFFWVTEEGYREAQPIPSSHPYFVPTVKERQGDFSDDFPAAATASNPSFRLFDPTHAFVGGARTCPLTSNGDCSTGAANVIPARYINPIGQFVVNAFPVPTSTCSYGTLSASPCAYNFSNSNTSFKSRSDFYSGKIEHTFKPWYTATASFVHLATQEPTGNVLEVHYSSAAVDYRYNDATAVNNTFVINPTTLLTVGFGFNRYDDNTFQYSTGFNPLNGFGGAGFSSGFANQLQSPTFPTMSISGVVTNAAGLGGSNAGHNPINYSRNVVVGVTKSINRHNVKFGYVFRSINAYTVPTGSGNGSFTFNGEYTTSNGTSATSTTGAAAIADLLMGLPSAASLIINSGSFNMIEHYNALYAQDDYRVNQKLTMNLGLRYEYELGQSESRNRFNVGFSPTAIGAYTNYAGNTVTTKGGLLFAGVNGAPTHCCTGGHTKFSPRIGLAYQPLAKTVIHAGFGVFYAPIQLVSAINGYSQASSYSPGNATGPVVAGASAYLSSPFSNGAQLLQPTGNTLGALTGVGGAVSVQDFGRRPPFVQQYSMDVQRDLPWSMDLKVAYVGAHARNYANATNINQAPDSVLTANAGTTNDLSAKVTNPYEAVTIGGLPATGVLAPTAAHTIAKGQLLLPYPQFTSVTLQQSNGYLNYNSLAVKVQKRLTQGLTVLATYTWAASWDNLWSAASQIYSTSGPQDAFNPKAEYARSLDSIPNRFTTGTMYELPLGRGKTFFSNSNRFVDEFIGGWQFNLEWIIQNGPPMSVTQTNMNTAFGTTGIGGTSQRPNLVGDAHAACLSGPPEGRLGNYATGLSETPYINASAFSPAPAYTYGNAPRSLPCRSPGFNSADLSVHKTFSIGERLKVQFRAEALNAFNTPVFSQPNQTYVVNKAATANLAPTAATGSSQSLGNLTSTTGYARVVQMGGRISF